MLKPMIFKMLENSYTGQNPCKIPDSLTNPFFSTRCHFATRIHPFDAKYILFTFYTTTSGQKRITQRLE